MTEQWNLELHDGIYCEKGQREQNGQTVDFWKKLLCYKFVEVCLLPNSPSNLIVVDVTDKVTDSDPRWVEVKVTRQGYYRWWWSLVKPELAAKNSMNGFYWTGEQILISMFPKDWDSAGKDGKKKDVVFLQEDGDVEEHSLWIRIITIVPR